MDHCYRVNGTTLSHLNGYVNAFTVHGPPQLDIIISHMPYGVSRG